VRAGRDLVLKGQLGLPNGQQIPNDGTGRGLKHGISTWLATRAQVAAPTQQVSFTREAPLHIPNKHGNRRSHCFHCRAHRTRICDYSVDVTAASTSNCEVTELHVLDFVAETLLSQCGFE
jgi:hypothetical protein